MATTWVMVPVPEEMVEPVQKFLLQLHIDPRRWFFTPDEAVEHVKGLRDQPAALAVEVAKRTRRGEALDLATLSKDLGVSEFDLQGLVAEVNNTPPDNPRWELIHLDEGTDGTASRLRMFGEHADAIHDSPAKSQ